MKDWYLLMRGGKWKVKEQASFLLKLGELLEHGYSLAQAIRFLTFQESKKRQEDLQEGMEQLKNGEALHQVLAEMKFHSQLVSYIYYGEQYGELSRALKEGGKYWTKRAEDLDKIKKLFIYPIFLLFFIGNVFFILQRVLLPKFETLFASMHIEHNIFLNSILAISAILPKIPIILLLLCILIYLLKRYWFNQLCPLTQRRLILHIPVIGMLIRLYETHFFASQFSGLLSGGLSINESIQLLAQNRQQPFYQKLCTQMQRELLEGKQFEAIVQKLSYFEKNLYIVIANGQKYGRLDEELFHYSRLLLERIEEKTSMIMRIIQPMLFSFIGLLIVSIYLAVLLPMFSLLNGL
ncbi:competence type IV pilus assembly protein ComGB [Peribacillus asahii]|nr:competence type IV pilus assembly protein ComGB [Peribacillus asahii]USK84071.1 type II secretion system F family protein [Peribacillus asahii]